MRHQNQHELERYWWGRVEEAKRQFETARAHTQKVESDFCGTIPSPDGQYAHRQALRTEREALLHYSQLLRAFVDLLLGGKIPEESEGGSG